MRDSGKLVEHLDGDCEKKRGSLFTWYKYALYCGALAIWLVAPVAALGDHPFSQLLAVFGVLAVILFVGPLMDAKRWFVVLPSFLLIGALVAFGMAYLIDLFDIQSPIHDYSLWHLAAVIYAFVGAMVIQDWVGLGDDSVELSSKYPMSGNPLTWGPIFTRKYVMVEVYRNRVKVIPLDGSSELVDIGSSEPFSTQRLLVGDFSAAEKALQEAIRRAVPRRFGLLRPRVSGLIYPVELSEGGLSEVEKRVLVEVAEGAGIYRSVIWSGPELTEAEALDQLKAC